MRDFSIDFIYPNNRTLSLTVDEEELSTCVRKNLYDHGDIASEIKIKEIENKEDKDEIQSKSKENHNGRRFYYC